MIRAVMMMPNWPNPPSTAKNNSGCLLGEQITSSPFPDKNTTCESLNISRSLNFSDGVPRIERKPFWFNEGTGCKCTCNNFKLQYVADFRAVSKRLSTNAGIGKGPANAEIEIVGPGPWSQTFLQCRFEHINPKLASGCIHVGHWAIRISLWHHLDPAKCRHFDNDSIQSLQTDHNIEITPWEAKKLKKNGTHSIDSHADGQQWILCLSATHFANALESYLCLPINWVTTTLGSNS